MQKGRVCDHFLKGSCKFGDACKFQHVADAGPSQRKPYNSQRFSGQGQQFSRQNAGPEPQFNAPQIMNQPQGERRGYDGLCLNYQTFECSNQNCRYKHQYTNENDLQKLSRVELAPDKNILKIQFVNTQGAILLYILVQSSQTFSGELLRYSADLIQQDTTFKLALTGQPDNFLVIPEKNLIIYSSTDVASGKGSVYIIGQSQQVNISPCHDGPIMDLKYVSDMVITASTDGCIKVISFNVEQSSSSFLHVLYTPSRIQIYSIALLSDGRFVGSCASGVICLWEMNTQRQKIVLKNIKERILTGDIWKVHAVKDGLCILGGSDMQVVIVNFLASAQEDEFCNVTIIKKFDLLRPSDQQQGPESILSIDLMFTSKTNLLIGTSAGYLYIINPDSENPEDVYKAKIPHQKRGQEAPLADIQTVNVMNDSAFYTVSKNIVNLWKMK